MVTERFVPVRVHVTADRAEFQRLGGRFGVQWTPTTLVVDAGGQERHRIEGFLPADDFVAQLAIGRGHAAFGQERFDDAEALFRIVLERHPESDAAAEAQYWAGVSRYKASNDAAALAETARQFDTRYSGTAWAKKASVWKQT